ncbi:hypothetical protein ACTA71_002105 [Dictyostelium dimigraforme]
MGNYYCLTIKNPLGFNLNIENFKYLRKHISNNNFFPLNSSSNNDNRNNNFNTRNNSNKNEIKKVTFKYGNDEGNFGGCNTFCKIFRYNENNNEKKEEKEESGIITILSGSVGYARNQAIKYSHGDFL